MQLKVARKEEAGVDRAFITAVPRDNPAWTSMAFIKIARQLGYLFYSCKLLCLEDYKNISELGTPALRVPRRFLRLAQL